MDELLRIIPAVVAALLAGIGAIAKTLYERRDERLTAHRQLELAVKRTEFVSGWVEACRSVAGDDDEFVASAARRVRAELDEAYEEAQNALANGRSVLAGERFEDARAATGVSHVARTATTDARLLRCRCRVLCRRDRVGVRESVVGSESRRR